MASLEFAHQIVDMNVEREKFSQRSLEALTSQEVQYSELSDSQRVPYLVMGNLATAESVVVTGAPYSTRITDSSQRIRYATQQQVLGEDHCLVAVQAYDPVTLRLNRRERKVVANGSFRPFADRTLKVISDLGLDDDTKLSLYGYSMFADVATQTAFQMLYDVNGGIRDIDHLGVFEPARVLRRLPPTVLRDFARSGPELFDNVVNSNMPALLEARGIENPTAPGAKKQHDKAVTKGVSSWVKADPSGNLSIVRGFGHDTTVHQLDDISHHSEAPHTVLGYATDSSITRGGTPFQKLLVERAIIDKFDRLMLPGDHSLADNVRNSAAYILATTAARL